MHVRRLRGTCEPKTRAFSHPRNRPLPRNSLEKKRTDATDLATNSTCPGLPAVGVRKCWSARIALRAAAPVAGHRNQRPAAARFSSRLRGTTASPVDPLLSVPPNLRKRAGWDRNNDLTAKTSTAQLVAQAIARSACRGHADCGHWHRRQQPGDCPGAVCGSRLVLQAIRPSRIGRIAQGGG